MLILSAIAGAVQSSTTAAPIYWADLGLKRGIDLGFFTLRFYSLAYLAGIILAFWQVSRMIRLPGAPMAQRHAEDLFFWCTMGVILGGRLGYATFYGPQLFAHPLDLLKLWEGGMSFHGGLIGVTLAIVWVTWPGGLSFFRVCDYIATCVPYGLFFGRLANFVNGELWGRVARPGVRWAMVFPDGGPLPRHPSQLYEAGLEGLVLAIVVNALFWLTPARWRPGLITGAFLVGYGIARFTIEFYREPDSQLESFAMRTGMSMGQWLTVPLILVGLALVVRALLRPALGTAATPAAAPASA